MAEAITVDFHRSLYLPEAVKAAATAYEAFCTVTVDETDIATVVTLDGFDSRYGVAFVDAFCNHALFETVVRSRETLGGVTI